MLASFRALRRSRVAAIALAILVAIVLASILAPFIAPYAPDRIDLPGRLKPPMWVGGGNPGHILGTDQLGRDVLSRMIWGARVSMFVGISTAAITAVIGVTVGLLAGVGGRAVDELLMRLADILLAFPFVLLALVAIKMLGPSLFNLVFVLSAFGWVGYARVVRGSTLLAKEKEFVQAAKVIGVRDREIVLKHLLPNVVSPAIVIATFVAASAIIAESSLSFLGLGLPPSTPSWGSMLADGRDNLYFTPWLCLFPGLAIMAAVLCFNLVGDWARDVLDPRLKV